MAVYSEPVYEEPKLTPKLSKYEKVLQPLMKTPGEWGKIGEYKSDDSAYQASMNLKHARYKIPGEASEWNFVNEGTEVFAMYLNGASEKSAAKPVAKTATKTAAKSAPKKKA
jgi:hypothetical protein